MAMSKPLPDRREPKFDPADGKQWVVLDEARWTTQREGETPSQAMRRLEVDGPGVHRGSPPRERLIARLLKRPSREKALQTHRLGRLQGRLMFGPHWRIANAIATFRYWLWRATGGRHE